MYNNHMNISKTLFFRRNVEPLIAESMLDTPVILLAGPRQVGKTTLVKKIAQDKGLRYLTLDDDLTLFSVRNDPAGVIRDLDYAVIDEIQRAPQLLLAIKKSVDEDRRPGRFLLTGSANLMTLPRVADSLAGRMETLQLLPLSQSEIESSESNWLDAAFSNRILTVGQIAIGNDLIERVLKGGYPEAISRSSSRRRTAWANQYLGAIIQRDIREVAEIEKLNQLPRFLQTLAPTVGQMCNYTRLGAYVGLDGKTVSRYIGIFEQMYLMKRIDVWSKNKLKRITKIPKLQFIDSGLLASLMGLNLDEIQKDRSRFGNVLETFVYGELLKHASTARGHYQLMCYRNTNQTEVDLVIESTNGDIVGVEIKAAASIQSQHLHGLRNLSQTAGDQFKMGILLYDGEETIPLGDKIWAAPISTLWGS